MSRKAQHKEQQGGEQEKPSFHKNHLLPNYSAGFDFLLCKCRRRWFSYRIFDIIFSFLSEGFQPAQSRQLRADSLQA